MASINRIALALLCAASVQSFAAASFADDVLPQAVRDAGERDSGIRRHRQNFHRVSTKKLRFTSSAGGTVNSR